MNHSKLGTKALGLCLLAALSVMAIAAAGAQAKGHLFVNLQLLNSEVEFEALEPVHGVMLTTFGGGETPLQILCEEGEVHDGLLSTEGSGTGEVLISKCRTLISSLIKANCKPLEPIVAKVKGLLIHHNGDTYILASPQSGLTFTTLHLGELCAVGENIEITGHGVAECGLLSGGSWTHEDCSVEKVEHEIQQAPAVLFSDGLKFGTRSAIVDGDIGIVTKGSHVGQKWGAQVIL